MLRIIQNNSAAGSKTYYTSSDYFLNEQELAGHWRGLGAARLGLTGNVGKDAWDALCDNHDPNTGKSLTPRRKGERRIGYDFNFHSPKSLSLLYGLTRDERLIDAFRESVDETMREMEAEMKTRVRRGGRNEDRTTGNMLWGEFVHLTSRPVNGVPDPHLHCHAFVFNSTFDSIENRWKAGQFADLKRDSPFFEAVFQSKLSSRIASLGLPVERTKHGWEIAGFGKETLAKFSRRTAQIEEAAHKKGITNRAAKAELGAKTREAKQKNLGMDELRQEWLSRLTADERNEVGGLERQIGTAADWEDPRRAGEVVAQTVSHCFERDSVVQERRFLREALRRSYGQVSRPWVEKAALGSVIRAEQGGQKLVSTRAMLAEESAMIGFAREGRGTCDPLGRRDSTFRRDWLSDEQRQAV